MRAATALLVLLPAAALAQDRLVGMPGYERYTAARKEIAALDFSFPQASIDGETLVFSQGGKWQSYDPATKSLKERKAPKTRTSGTRRGPERGRQFDTVASPNGKWRAVYRDRNIVIESTDGKEKIAVTSDGSVEKRIKNGTASWVYGEELGQNEAMWFSPDSGKLAYYRFDESKVPDYILAVDQGKLYSKPYVEAYPKAGAPNPVVDLYVYDLGTRKSTRVDVRFSSFDADLGHYVYGIRWHDANRLLFLRLNRLQNAQELCVAEASTGKTRAFHRESNPGGWVDARPGTWGASTDPLPTFDGRFLWVSEASGFRNFLLVGLDGPPKELTSLATDVRGIVRVDDRRGELWYEAGSPEPGRHARVQLHRVNRRGQDVLLTDGVLSHAVTVAPDGNSFSDTAEAWDTPATVTLRDRNGKELTKVGEMKATAWPRAVPVSAVAGDGKSLIYGRVQLPREIPAGTRVPLILEVYGGPDSGTDREKFIRPDPRTELGFAVAWCDGRGTQGRGRAFRQSVYRKLGVPEIDDQAAFARTLGTRPEIDPKRIGISGVSYGGYASLLALLRYPEVFAAASSGSPVTDWRLYDSIYTERYMALPEENAAGYDAGSAMKLAKNLKGRLLLYLGTSDDNVHPSNTWQFIEVLDREGKSYDLAVGVDRGHSGVRRERELEFFIEALVLSRGR